MDGFVTPLCSNTIDGEFDKPFENSILTTDLLSPFDQKIDPVLVTCLGYDLAHRTRFWGTSFFDGFVTPLCSNTIDGEFDKPFENSILATDLLSPFDQKISPVLVTCLGYDLAHAKSIFSQSKTTFYLLNYYHYYYNYNYNYSLF